MTSSIKQLNTGKAPAIYGVTTEHILYAGNTIVYMLVDVMNAIFNLGQVPDILKHGTITPVFKKKGSKNEAKIYRGITVLPVIAKLLELLLRSRMRAVLDPQQNPMQRGFTQRSSPLYCALIIEEFIRMALDRKEPSYAAYLDAKTASDVVNHNSLLRKLFNVGVSGKLWTLIQNFHVNATSVVKWDGSISSSFSILQGVRQGGI